MRATAAQRAVDLELAGLGDAEEIFQTIVDETYAIGTDLLAKSKASIQEGGSRQRAALEEVYNVAKEEYQSSITKAKSEYGAGFDKVISGLDAQYQNAEEGFRGAISDGRQLVERELAAGKDALGGFEGGKAAFRVQLAMSGALGPEAEKKFYDEYQNSPGVKYQLEEAARLVSSGESGGTKMARLMERGLGIISSDLDSHFAELGTLSERAQRGGENLAELSGRFGGIFGALAETEAKGIGDIRTGLAETKADLGAEKVRGLGEMDISSADFVGGLSKTLGVESARSFAEEGKDISNLYSDALKPALDYQQYVADKKLGLSTARTSIISDLERELAGIESGRELTQAGLGAEALTGQATTLAEGRIDAADARSAGRISGADVTRGTITDIASGLGAAATGGATLAGDVSRIGKYIGLGS